MQPGRTRPYRVLIVDDSAFVRQALTDIVESSGRLQVMATAGDPFQAADRIRREVPDVMILDIEMPRMDGISFLHQLMGQRPLPVVICSAKVADGSDVLSAALDAGAVDIVLKPALDRPAAFQESRVRICDALVAAAVAGPPRPRRLSRLPPPALNPGGGPVPQAPSGLPISAPRAAAIGDRIIAIGVSTGGPEALRVVLQGLPPDCPPVVVVQHMPEGFTAAFARRLDGLCAISVREARDGDRCECGTALIAPGNKHMTIGRRGAGYAVSVRDGAFVSRHRPSVDVLFRSVARAAGADAIGLIMTGMGDDGALGLLAMREAGAQTLGQDKQSSLIYGMPQAAMRLGAVMGEHDLGALARAVMAAARAAKTTAPTAPGRC